MLDKIIDEHIINIIQNHKIFEQSDLQKILEERGYNITQATLSRRLKKLNVVKVSGVYKIIGLSRPNLPQILNLQVSEFGLIVLHTNPGNANALAIFIDRKYVNYSTEETTHSGLLGTIAGDDTVLLIIKKKTDLKHILTLLKEDFPYLP